MKSCFLRLAVAGGCLLLVAAAAACGGDEQEAPSSTAGPSPASTPEAVPTIDPSVPLVEYRSPDWGYSVSYPEGWEVEAASGDPLATFSWTLDGRPLAQLNVVCNEDENQTLDSFMQQSETVVSKLSGKGLSEPTPIEIAGIPGKQITYTYAVGGFVVEQVAAFALKGNRGYRIGLATYGVGSLQSYLPLFERIIASFRLD